MNLVRRTAFWAVPPLVCVALYRYGLTAWFMQDDFAWLRLARAVQEGESLRTALFAPMAQGTIRPLSERGFFIVFYGLFGLDSLPFRIWVFLTQIANLALIAAITRRVTGSRLAGFFAPILWICGSTLYVVMTWNSVYNQALCAFCLLLAFYCFLRYLETGSARWYWLQWIPFLAGFGALEIAVVYPALAAAFAPRQYRRTLPLFLPSVAYGLWHLLAVPKQDPGTYGLHFDGALASTLWTYWQWALGPAQLAMVVRVAPWLTTAATLVLTLAVIAGLVRGGRLPLFFLAWFLITLAPVLPLKNHISDYYLTIPAIGLAMLGGWALARYRTLAVVPVALYLAVSVPAAAISTRASRNQSLDVKRVVLGVVRAHALHPGRVILLEGVTERLYWDAVRDDAFEAAGVPNVYLTPGSLAGVPAAVQVMSPEPVQRALNHGEAVVYQVSGPRLRNITRTYGAGPRLRLSSGPPARVDVANPLHAYLLGPEWHAIDQGFRWMPKRATVRIAGPRAPGQRLYLAGRCLRPVRVSVAIDGAGFPAVEVTPGEFQLSFAAPPGRERMEVAVEVDRTFRMPPDRRDLGLAFGVFEVR